MMSKQNQQKIERYDKISEIIDDLNDNNILDSINMIKCIVEKPFHKDNHFHNGNTYSWKEAINKTEYIINELRKKIKSGKLKNGDVLDLDEYKLTINASNGCINNVHRILRFNMGVCKLDLLKNNEILTDAQSIFKTDRSNKIPISDTLLNMKEYKEQRKQKLRNRYHKSLNQNSLRNMLFA